jgi:uncharacterized protein (DUF433 family)
LAIPKPTSHERVGRNPEILGGEPVVLGTRLPVRGVVLAAREFGGEEGAMRAYPHLAAADVRAALEFYEAHREEIDRYIRSNLAED